MTDYYIEQLQIVRAERASLEATNRALVRQRGLLLDACKVALVSAENLRRATGDAIPGGICFTLSHAISEIEGKEL